MKSPLKYYSYKNALNKSVGVLFYLLVEEYGKIKICCGFGELLAQPADMFWTFSKIPPNSAQKTDSIT